jgi:hypothetical protein
MRIAAQNLIPCVLAASIIQPEPLAKIPDVLDLATRKSLR